MQVVSLLTPCDSRFLLFLTGSQLECSEVQHPNWLRYAVLREYPTYTRAQVSCAHGFPCSDGQGQQIPGKAPGTDRVSSATLCNRAAISLHHHMLVVA